MKKKFVCLLLFTLLMVIIPLAAEKKQVIDSINLNYSKHKTDNLSNEEILSGLVCKEFKKEYNEETLKALVIILNSNYKFNKKKEGYWDKDKFIGKYDEKAYEKVENAVKSAGDLHITYKGKTAYIPYFYKSCGYTTSSKKYPYIKTSASPWDMAKNSHKVGISLNGINNLCKNGASYKDALGWYLENCKIEN